MNRSLRTVLRLIWSLWFGGIISLFILVQVLFARVERETFIASAPQLFFAFERYQLVLAAIALSLTIVWRLFGDARMATIVFIFLAIATVIASFETAVITPKINQMRVRGEIQTPQFGKLHGESMLFYVGEACVLLVGGVLLMLDGAAVDDEHSPAGRG